MKRFSSITLSCLLFQTLLFAYGERADTIPDWQERAVLTLCNMCRLAPEAYRDSYLGTSGILLPATYPAVAPFVWNYSLNASSRYHAVEMAGSCGMQHDCNGQTFDVRIKTFYKESATGFGENIAKGYASPQEAVKAWLLDSQGGTAAADGSGSDGHRANIMSKKFTVVGCGYYLSGSGSNAASLWCQDFASVKGGSPIPPVPSASHLFFTKGTITFLVNVFDTTLVTPNAVLFIDNIETPLSLSSGAANRGTYSVALPTATTCRSYWFELRDNSTLVRRYPDTGYLLTTGEGSCTGDFSMATTGGSVKPASRAGGIPLVLRKGVCSIVQNSSLKIRVTEVFDAAGTMVCRYRWPADGKTAELSIGGNGVSFIRHTLRDGTSQVHRICTFR